MKNQELELAQKFVNTTQQNLFLTGKAGTGKTTFLKNLKHQTYKHMVVVAPTGVAAINAGGVTIHSFFQMPFGPIIPGGTEQPVKKFNRKKINIIRTLDLLVIDEISMVRADLLDGIDQVLRRFRDRTKVFGGVQILMIGDIQQLAPVVKPNEWQLLSKHYQTPYFFSSKSFQEADVIPIELLKIYRQENKTFINILEEIRNNRISDHSLTILNKRYQPDFDPPSTENYIRLTTHNKIADEINKKELDKIDNKSFFFEATVKGNFPDYNFPTNENLVLKKGAQVMFIKNDSSSEKRYYNGKIGTIVSLDQENISVHCPGDEEAIHVTPEVWENVNYSIDQRTSEIKEEHIGSFTQIPLKWAWAITIHKSQGLTFDKAIIDASASFAHGQTYVALSRCRSLEGLVLQSKISPNAIISDTQVQSFTKKNREQKPDEQALLKAQVAYQLQLIAQFFDFYPLIFPLQTALKIFYKNKKTLKGSIEEPLKKLKDEYLTHILKISTQFKKQLDDLQQKNVLPEKNEAIQTRFAKAKSYYYEFLNDKLLKTFEQIQFNTDNKDVRKDLEKQLKNAADFLQQKLYVFKHSDRTFSSQKYLKTSALATLEKETKPKEKKKFTGQTKHPKLFAILRAYRMEMADIEMVAPYQIFTQNSLYEMCEVLPVTNRQLRNINGMGKVRVQRYGQEIISLIEEYCKKNELTPDYTEPELSIKKPKKPKGETYRITLELVKLGKNIAEIAKERGLVQGTIESHIAKLIQTGEITIEALPNAKKLKELQKIIRKTKYENLTELRSKIGDAYSFGEMRIVIAHLNLNNS